MMKTKFQAVRVEGGKIVERDPNIFDQFELIDAKVKELSSFGGDWGFEEIKNA